MKNVVDLQFVSEVRPEVVRDISKSVLRKSILHMSHAFMDKVLGTEMCIRVRVITGNYCSKSDWKEEDRGRVVRSFALRVDGAIWTER